MSHPYNKPYEYMTKTELDTCYLPENWSQYDANEKLSILQETENRFAAQMFRPAKTIAPKEFSDATLGVWLNSDDTIYINSSLIQDGVINTLVGPISRPDAPFLLYNTVAHEGYHAYQSYAIDNPRLHDDKEQLEEWKLNNEIAVTSNGIERNYIAPENGNMYRIQPLERDAIIFADKVTQEAFDQIQSHIGIVPEYENDYKDLAEACSYETALHNQMKYDPNCIEHMKETMESNRRMWNGESDETNMDNQLSRAY